MRRHLCLEIVRTSLGVIGHVVEQTHRRADFDPDNIVPCLRSTEWPEWNQNKKLYLQGFNSELDSFPFAIPTEDFPEIEKAVRKYNSHYGGSESEAEPYRDEKERIE